MKAALKVPFLVTFTEMVTSPLELVVPLKVLPFTLTVTCFPLIAFLPSFKVTLTLIAFLTFPLTLVLAAVKVVAFLFTVI